jgi:hypothetical protein
MGVFTPSRHARNLLSLEQVDATYIYSNDLLVAVGWTSSVFVVLNLKGDPTEFFCTPNGGQRGPQ